MNNEHKAINFITSAVYGSLELGGSLVRKGLMKGGHDIQLQIWNINAAQKTSIGHNLEDKGVS